MLKERTQQIAEYAKDGLTAKQIGYELGVSSCYVRNFANKTGIKIKKEEDCDYRDHVANMKPPDAVNYLLEVLDALAPSLQKSAPRRFNFTHYESIVFALLEANADRFVSRSKIMDRLYCTYAADDVPQEKGISVVIYKIRNKIANSNLSIVTRQGLGYKLTHDAEPDGK